MNTPNIRYRQKKKQKARENKKTTDNDHHFKNARKLLSLSGHRKITSLTFLLTTSQATRERKPPATDNSCTMRVATERGRFPQYAVILAGSYTNGRNSLLSSTYTIEKIHNHIK